MILCCLLVPVSKQVVGGHPGLSWLNCRNLLTPTNLGLHPTRSGAIKLVAPSVLLLRMAVINIVSIVLDKRLKSNHTLLVKPLMLFT